MAYYVVLGEVPVKRKLDFVEFESSELVMNLRHAIYDKKKNTIFKQNIDESDLVLWKVDIPFGNENDKLKMLDDTSYTIKIFEGKEMFSGDPISDHLERFDKTRRSIHIIVQPHRPQPLGKGKWWRMRKIIEQKTMAKSIPEINIQYKVFKIPSLPEDKRDMDIYSRECYKYLRDFILKDTKFSRYLITGNLGIGKTFFGRVMLIVLLKENKNVLLDYEIVTALIYPSSDMDVDQLGHNFSNGKLIMVSSPKKSIIGIFAKQWCKELHMPIWNEFEDEDYIKSAIKQALVSAVGPGMLCNQAKDFPDYIAYKCLKRLKENKEDLRTFIETAMESLCGQLFELVSHEILGTFPVRKLTGDGALGPETTLTLEFLEEIFI
ncbi:hypothetical protein C1646_771313 [Rhizophagus diaphanus]|nr:hypothetical protein C1646_771313 [Rhizophagus diaphanus] [Rhizophagus sp. MUCL 43196]